MEGIGEYIKALRENKNYSQRKLSGISGVSNATINRMERKITFPDTVTLRKLSPALDVPYEELLRAAGYLNNGERYEPDLSSYRQSLSHISDNELKEWMQASSSIDYIIFAKKIHDMGIDPKLILDEFIFKDINK